MSTSNSVANGARLHDCHSNVFSLADLSGIKWHKFSSNSVGLHDDPVLAAFTKCLSLDILAVWRRSPRKNLSTSYQETFEKELWIFWWGEEPQVNEIIQHKDLRDEEKGSWDDGLSYECRTLLFKAIHNLVERCLLNENFVRIGRWFIKPLCKDADEDISDRFSFSFSFFLHGESSVCTTVEVAKHENLERLTCQYLQQATSSNTQNTVVLAPYGLEAKLTGSVYRSPHEPMVKKVVEEWRPFYPLGSTDDLLDDASDEDNEEQIPVPPVVEVVLCGIPMNYPSHFVLVPSSDNLPCSNTTSTYKSTLNKSVEDAGMEGTSAVPSMYSKYLVDQVRMKSKQTSGASIPALPLLANDKSSEVTAAKSIEIDIKEEPPDMKVPSWNFADTFKDVRLNYFKSDSNQFPLEGRKSVRLERQYKYPHFMPYHRRCLEDVSDDQTSNYNASTTTRSSTLDNLTGNCDVFSGHNTSTLHTMPSPLSNPTIFQNHDKLYSESLLEQNSPVDKLLSRPFVTLGLGNMADTWSNNNEPAKISMAETAINHSIESSIEIQRTVDGWKHYKIPLQSKCEATRHHAKRPAIDCDDPIQNTNSHSKMPSDTNFLYSCPISKRKKVQGQVGKKVQHPEESDMISYEGGAGSHVTVGTVKGELAGMSLSSDPYAFDDDVDDTMPSCGVNSDISLKKIPQPTWTSEVPWPTNPHDTTDVKPTISESINGMGGLSQLEALLTKHNPAPIPASQTSTRLSSSSSIGKSLKNKSDLKVSMDDLNVMFDDEDIDGGAPTPPNDDNHNDDVTTLPPATSYAVNADLQRMFPTPPSLESCQAISPEGRAVPSVTNNASSVPDHPAMNGMEHNFNYYKRTTDVDKRTSHTNQLNAELPVHLTPPKKQETLLKHGIDEHPTSSLYQPIMCLSQLPHDYPSYTPSWQIPACIPHQSYGLAGPETLNFQPATPITPGNLGVTPGTPGHSVRTPTSVQPPYSDPAPQTPRTPGCGGVRSVESPRSFAMPNSNIANKESYVDHHGNTAIFMNLLLSDSIFNLFWDKSFDQCALCVCNTNINGADVESGYLPALTPHEAPYPCTCGYSAVRNRSASVGAGLFLEDELEIVGAQHENAILLTRKFAYSKTSLRDDVILFAMEACSTPFVTSNVFKKKPSQHIVHDDNVVIKRDVCEVFAQALSNGLNMLDHPSKIEPDAITNPIHPWNKSQSDILTCGTTYDMYHLLVSLKPVLQDAIQKKRTTRSFETTQHVKGPLTWREFCKEAGKNAEPQPIPSFIVGYDHDWLSISPCALKYWEKFFLEPYSSPRDIVYAVVCPDGDNITSSAKIFFKELASVFESYRLGRFKPYNKVFKESGIINVGKNNENTSNQPLDDWFNQYQQSVAQTHNKSESEKVEKLLMYARSCVHHLGSVLKEEENLDVSSLHVREGRSRTTNQSSTNTMPPSGVPTSLFNMSNQQNIIRGNASLQSSQPTRGKDVKDVRVQYPNPYDASTASSIVIFILDPFQGSMTNGLWQCFVSLRNSLPKPIRDHLTLQVVPVEEVLQSTSSNGSNSFLHILRSLSFNTFAQCRKRIAADVCIRSMTGFGPKVSDKEFSAESIRDHAANIYSPPYVLSLPYDRCMESSLNHKMDAEYNVLFVSYCLSHNQKWVLASATDQRGEILETCCINIDVPPRRLSVTRKHRVSVRGEAIHKLWKFCINTSSNCSIKAWRFVIGKLGRLSHGEIRDWAKYLNRKSLLASGKRNNCSQCKLHQNGEAPFLISACLTSMEPDGALRIMPDVVQTNNFGRSSVAVNQTTQLKTPEDISCTHVYVYPTSAVTQLPDSNRPGNEEDSYFPQPDADFIPADVLTGLEEDLFIDFGGLMEPTSPASNQHNFSISDADDINNKVPMATSRLLSSEAVSSEDASLSQQPLALGYMVSTAPPGPLPSWFWVTCPHARDRCPVFLRSALHIQTTVSDVTNQEQHPLDSNKTAVVLRFVLENYNALSWLTTDPVSRDRRSCLPVHCLSLIQLYQTIENLVT